LRWVAKLLLIWTPPFLKAKACREMSAEFTALVIDALDGEGPLEAFRGAAWEAGKRSGDRLKNDLCLGGGYEDAELAWRLVSKFSGMKFTVTRRGGKSLFDHHVCPVLESGGLTMCRNFCVPFVEGLTASMCPSCAVEIIKGAEGGEPCVKALANGGQDA